MLRSLGLSEDVVRSSVRFGLGRFNTAEEVEFTIAKVAETVAKLRKMSSRGDRVTGDRWVTMTGYKVTR